MQTLAIEIRMPNDGVIDKEQPRLPPESDHGQSPTSLPRSVLVSLAMIAFMLAVAGNA